MAKKLETFIWDEKHECMSEDERRALVSERIVKCLDRMYKNVPYYKKKLDDAGIDPSDIKGVDDLYKLPFIDKFDFANNYPFGTLAVPKSEIVRFHASSGTTGRMKVVGYTKNDVALWSDMLCRAFAAAGFRKGDSVHISYGYGLFTGGLGPHYACEPFGATALPVSTGQTDRQIQILTEWKPEAICCTPSYMLNILDRMDEKGISKDELNLRCGLFGAEAWTKEMKQEIEERAGIKAFDIYGLSEICGPGVGCSCEKGDLIHIQADNFWPEVVDPETGKPLPDGELGELVFSSIMKEGVPLLRYNTHDLTRIWHGKCECGRTTPRIEKITGRADDMIIVRGVNLFPSQIEEAIGKHTDAVAMNYMIYVDRVNNKDTIYVKVELKQNLVSDTMKGIEMVGKAIEADITSITGLHIKVLLVGPNSLPKSEGKIKRVIDSRFKN